MHNLYTPYMYMYKLKDKDWTWPVWKTEGARMCLHKSFQGTVI